VGQPVAVKQPLYIQYLSLLTPLKKTILTAEDPVEFDLEGIKPGKRKA